MSCYCATKWGYLLIFIGWLTWGFVWLPTSKTAAPSPPSTFLYFAYGSNLLTERIHFQNPSATFRGVAKLDGYKLDFRLPTKVRISQYVKIYTQTVCCRGGMAVQLPSLSRQGRVCTVVSGNWTWTTCRRLTVKRVFGKGSMRGLRWRYG